MLHAPSAPLLRLGAAGLGIAALLAVADTLHGIPGATNPFLQWLTALPIGGGGTLWIVRQIRDLRVGSGGHSSAQAIEHVRQEIEDLRGEVTEGLRVIGERLARVETHRENQEREIAQVRDQTDRAIAGAVEQMTTLMRAYAKGGA